MYLTLASLRRFEAEGRQDEDLPLVCWSAEYGLHRVQESFEGILANLGGPLGWLWRGPARWVVRMAPVGREPSDDDGKPCGRKRSAAPTRDADRLTAASTSIRAATGRTSKKPSELSPRKPTAGAGGASGAAQGGAAQDGDIVRSSTRPSSRRSIERAAAELVRRPTRRATRRCRWTTSALDELRGDRR